MSQQSHALHLVSAAKGCRHAAHMLGPGADVFRRAFRAGSRPCAPSLSTGGRIDGAAKSTIGADLAPPSPQLVPISACVRGSADARFTAAHPWASLASAAVAVAEAAFGALGLAFTGDAWTSFAEEEEARAASGFPFLKKCSSTPSWTECTRAADGARCRRDRRSAKSSSLMG
jgi:hypothetical protein